MTEINKPDAPIVTVSNYLTLRPGTVESVFTDFVMDLKEILVLDGIDILPDGFRVRWHDLHGQLPEITVENSGDTFRDKDRLGNAVSKIIAIVKLRDEMIRFLPGARILLPMRMDDTVIVSLQAKPRTWLGEGGNFLAAYHDLHWQIVG